MISVVKIKGMSCNHCSAAVAEALNEIPGITGVRVNLGTGEASIEHTENLDSTLIREKVEQAGYEIG